MLEEWDIYPSGIVDILKLAFLKIIPTDVTERIIIVDSDLLFSSDIRKLWNYFENFNSKQVIGLIRGESNRSLIATILQRIDEKEVISTVMLYHLKHLTSREWEKLWFTVATKSLSRHRQEKQENRDVIYQIIKNHLELVYFLPCQWNTQSNNSRIIDCGSINALQHVISRVSYLELDKFNPSLLEGEPNDCKESSTSTTTTATVKEDPCFDFSLSGSHRWRTLTFLKEFRHEVTTNDVTFVTQMTLNKMHILEQVGNLWNGPISVAVYVNDSELYQFIDFINSSKVLQSRPDIAYHAVFKEESYYPINVLRNVALRNAITPYVFLVDVDFITMPNLYSTLKAEVGAMGSMEKRALIVPAFETNAEIPVDKAELIKMLNNSELFVFHQNKYSLAHKPTNYEWWKTAKAPYRIRWKPEFEPYIVVQKNVTEYDERFLGYGWNKVSHIMELHKQRYEFIVLPNAYIVHKNHPWTTKFEKSTTLYRCIQQLRNQFIKELKTKYWRGRRN